MLKAFMMLIVPTIVVFLLVIFTKMMYEEINAVVSCAFNPLTPSCSTR